MVRYKSVKGWRKKNGVIRVIWKAKPAVNFPTHTNISMEIKLQSTVQGWDNTLPYGQPYFCNCLLLEGCLFSSIRSENVARAKMSTNVNWIKNKSLSENVAHTILHHKMSWKIINSLEDSTFFAVCLRLLAVTECEYMNMLCMNCRWLMKMRVIFAVMNTT